MMISKYDFIRNPNSRPKFEYANVLPCLCGKMISGLLHPNSWHSDHNSLFLFES